MTHRILGSTRRLVRDGRGYVTILTAGAMTMLMGAAALGVDVGSLYVAKRQLQGVADAAALAAAATSADPLVAARGAVRVNAVPGTSVASLVRGRYTRDPSLDAGARFIPDAAGGVAGGASTANASQVVVAQTVPLFFGRLITGRPTMRVTATALAARIDMAAFSLGTRLAALQGGLPNALLSGLAGTNLNVSVMDYTALAGADVDALAFASALRTTLDLDAATFGETLNTTTTLPKAVEALAAATTDQTAASALRAIALKLPPTSIQLSKLIDLGPLAGQRTVDPANVFEFDSYAGLREILQLANGQRTVAFGTGVSVPGLVSTQLSLASGQRTVQSPWLAVAKDNAVVVRTAQTRLYVDTQIGGLATFGLASLRLPIFVELASASASLSRIACTRSPATGTVSLDVTPSVGNVTIADVATARLNDFTTPITTQRATIAHALLVDVSGYADVKLGGVAAQPLTFSADDIAQNRVRSVSTNDLAQGLASSLIRSMDLRIGVLGLGLNVSAITAAVGSALSVAAPALDGLLDQVTGLLGVRVGQADVQVNGLRCGRAVLVA
ncbi:pilus assembly protein TadG-related protein [Sphingomonas sp. Leaf38]|uniref:pilus assembly protein TadG-related protein n=1 Tax=Sphingomonas sp. Leaf38 TaxID=1736217 RepID=UPI000A432A79|nr:pilus assembly protein TadG-related protein [Sphingomonas sp. Leaf38]